MRRTPLTVLLLVAATAMGLGLRAWQTSRSDQSYGVGYAVGERAHGGLVRDGVDVDNELLVKGFADGLGGAEPMYTRDEMSGLLAAVHHEMERRMVERLKEASPEFRQLSQTNLKLSRAFHEEFGRHDGVVTLPDGVQYLILRRGPVGGAMPRPGDTVVVDAKVQLLDGTVLVDQEGAMVNLDDIVPGGAEVLTLMKVGDRFQVAVPPPRAHGEAGRYPDVGPNESVVGIVELREVKRR